MSLLMLVFSILVAVWLLTIAAVVVLCHAAQRGDAALERPEPEVRQPARTRRRLSCDAPVPQARRSSGSAH
jgi:hypothetical protein